jgi:hypothetical protein
VDFLGGFFWFLGWVFYCRPCKQVGFVDGPRGGHIAKRRQRGAVGFSNAAVASLLPDDDVVFDTEKRSEQAGRGRPIYGAGGGGRKNWRPIQRRGGPGRTPPGTGTVSTYCAVPVASIFFVGRPNDLFLQNCTFFQFYEVLRNRDPVPF